MTLRCKSCGGLGARRMVIVVSHRHISRQWIVVVCRDCWRAWEALLESASEGIQQMLQQARVEDGQSSPWLW